MSVICMEGVYPWFNFAMPYSESSKLVEKYKVAACS